MRRGGTVARGRPVKNAPFSVKRLSAVVHSAGRASPASAITKAGNMVHAIRQQTGIVFNIQKYSVHDGPGIRTVVFLSGCPLCCQWCSNPESQRPAPQLAYNRKKCLTFDQCNRCMAVCTAEAIGKDDANRALIDREICTDCLLCADVCPPRALMVYGEEKSVAEVIDAVEQDGAFYSRSGGGLTLSGGEPLHQAGFAIALLKEARRRRINTAMETSGFCITDDLVTAGEYINTLLYDLKVMDDDQHKSYTGVSNAGILKNLKVIRKARPELPILVRTPVVPGVNDTPAAIRAILEFITDMPNIGYEMLPYHRLGTPKYTYLGGSYPLGDVKLDETVMPTLERLLHNEFKHLMPLKAERR